MNRSPAKSVRTRSQRSSSLSAGAAGERAARRALRAKGYTFVEANVLTASGEADLLMIGPDGRTVIIVEVKARSLRNDADGARAQSRNPEAALTAKKRTKLYRVAQEIVRDRGLQGRPVRIDLVAVDLAPRSGVGRLVRRWSVRALRHYPSAVIAS